MRDLAIRNTHSTVVTINAGIDARDKDGNVVELDESKIKTEQDKLKKEFSDQAYARTRQSLYPDIGDQLDDLFHQGAFSKEMTAKIQKVKDEFPKPE